ncbi:MAG: 16S rRNA (cytidine(1402)-2'-O)-methyltransferase [Clostridia bacterium]|nr:16S rRNA (cytidine(1402)-2'-O)-methyltransferase [Clostridia bacterium]
MSGTLYLCATPIGNLEDITYRCVRTLGEVDLIAAEDTRRTLGLLNHLGIEKPLTSYYEHNKAEKGPYLVGKLLEGCNIALVSDAGTPAICDPGEDLVKLCIKAGVPIVPVPGAVAAVTALIPSGLSTIKFAFEGFISTNKKNRIELFERLKNETRTMIFYEAPHKLQATLEDMYKYWGDRQITICHELTKIHEEFLRTTLSEAVHIYEEIPPKGEFVLIVEGRSEEEIAEEEKSAWEQMSIKEHFDFHITQGLSEKDAIKQVAKDRGMRKQDVYKEIKIAD